MIYSYLRRNAFFLLGLAATITFSSCSDDEDALEQPITYNVPTTYTFDNVNYAGQVARLAMLSELGTYVKSANDGAVLDAQVLKNMYANTNNAFADASLNTSGKQLKDKTISIAQAEFEQYLEAVAQASQSAGATAEPGKAGILASRDGLKKYLVDGNGIEYNQLIQKGLMGAVFYNQAVEGYLSPEKIGPTVDNTTVTPGQGTQMEHHWDEAFGYFGAPIDFPTNQTGLQYWASYSNQVNPALNSNKTLMDAFLKGRAAIVAKDMKGKDAAVVTIRTEWERLMAAAAIHELNAAKKNVADQALKSHYLSEALGFAMGLQYKTDRKLTDAKYKEFTAAIGTNLFAIDAAQIDAAISILSTTYAMDALKGQL